MQFQLENLSLAGDATGAQLRVEAASIGAAQKDREGPSHDFAARSAEQVRAGEIDFSDDAGLIDVHVADGRKVVQISVKISRKLEFSLNAAQFAVLHLQLDLVNLQFVNEPLQLKFARGRLRPAHGRAVALQAGQALLEFAEALFLEDSAHEIGSFSKTSRMVAACISHSLAFFSKLPRVNSLPAAERDASRRRSSARSS